MKSVTARQMKAFDQVAIKQYGMPSLLLMENAGKGIADLAQKMAGKKKNILVVCGKGNNGGDGFVSARHLANKGFKVSIALLGKANQLSRDAKVNYRIAKKMKIPVKRISNLKKFLKTSDLIVDAIFGVGLTRPVEGIFYKAISLINASKKPILAIDVPSGLDSDRGKVLGISIKAKMTGTLAVAKKGLFVGKGPEYSGKVHVIDISIPYPLISRYTTH